jgi:hypothetical protein
MMARGDNERADAMTIRAYNDATVALALTRQAELNQEFETLAAAHPDVQVPANVSPELEVPTPPGPSTPRSEPVPAADD